MNLFIDSSFVLSHILFYLLAYVVSQLIIWYVLLYFYTSPFCLIFYFLLLTTKQNISLNIQPKPCPLPTLRTLLTLILHFVIFIRIMHNSAILHPLKPALELRLLHQQSPIDVQILRVWPELESLCAAQLCAAHRSEHNLQPWRQGSQCCLQGCEGSACFLCFYVYGVRHSFDSVDIVLVSKWFIC